MHDDPIITLEHVRRRPEVGALRRARQGGKASINGVDISNRAKATELAKKIVEFRAKHTAEAIKKAIANKGTLPAPPRTQQ